ISLAAGQQRSHFVYAEFLEKQGLRDAALESYSWASSLAPTDLRPRYAMMRLYTAGQDWANLRRAVEEAQEIAPADQATESFSAVVRNHPDSIKGAEELARSKPTPENYLALSNVYCLAGEYVKCLGAAQQALKLRPNYAEAYNNAGAAFIS